MYHIFGVGSSATLTSSAAAVRDLFPSKGKDKQKLCDHAAALYGHFIAYMSTLNSGHSEDNVPSHNRDDNEDHDHDGEQSVFANKPTSWPGKFGTSSIKSVSALSRHCTQTRRPTQTIRAPT